LKVQLSEYSWPEVKELRERDPVVIVPVGAFEQHGHHLPLMVDWFLSSQVASRAAEEASRAGTPTVVTPPVWTGYSPHHMDFPGTITLDAATFNALLSNIARSLAAHGFRRLLFLNGHGGNANLIRSTVQTLRFEHDVDIAAASYWDFALPEITAWRKSDIGGINHACEMETSLMLALREDLTHVELAQDLYLDRSSYLPTDLTVGGPVTRAATFRELSEHGAIGAPTLADKERGEALLEQLSAAVAAFVQKFAQWPLREESSS
jgi:creatinine amidohydrolase